MPSKKRAKILAEIEAERQEWQKDEPYCEDIPQTVYVVKTLDIYPKVEQGEYLARFDFSYQARVELGMDDFIHETGVLFHSSLEWGDVDYWDCKQCKKFIAYGKRKIRKAKTELLRDTYKGLVEMAQKTVEADGRLFFVTTY